jgi:hypothetical protein
VRNRIFFPQETLDIWVASDCVDFSFEELLLKGENRRYRTIEAVRVVEEVAGGGDPNELIGKVKSRAYLAELGAEILEGSMVIGDSAYDIVPGFAGEPIGSIEDHRLQNPDSSGTDEEILAAFIAKAT